MTTTANDRAMNARTNYIIVAGAFCLLVARFYRNLTAYARIKHRICLYFISHDTVVNMYK